MHNFAWRLEDLFSTCQESTSFIQVCWDELFFIHRQDACSAAQWSWLTDVVVLPTEMWQDHQQKETKTHVSGQNMAETIQTLICLVLFDSRLHLVASNSHRIDGKITWQQTPSEHKDIKGCEGRRYSKRKVFIFPGERLTMKTQTLEKHRWCHVNCKNLRHLPPHILFLDRSVAISDFLQVLNIAK